jgi:hypothetical protein
MSERAALILLISGLVLVLLAAVVVLEAMHAGGDTGSFVYLAVLSAGGISCGRVVVHYADKASSKHDRR